jgi:1-acyl-sn-glycerol-3-phosphate acyltransferase
VFAVYYLFKVLCQCLLKLVGYPSVLGREHIPSKSPFILVANHQSILDPLVLMACIPRRITFLAAAYIFKIPLVGQIVRAGGALPVKSQKGDLASMKQALSQLSRGGVIGIFPEGGVSMDGQMRPFLPGWAYLALKAGVPVVPVAISGTRQVLPVGKYIPRRGKIRVSIGEPLYIEKKSRIHRKDLDQLNDEMMRIVSRLMGNN